MTNPRPNPYPGPRPFKRGEQLYGRERETAELLGLLIAERIVLLSSPSGAGKTSLVQAALVPELEREGFRVLPVMRPGLLPDEPVAGANRYILKALYDLEEGLHEDETKERQVSLAELGAMSMAGYLDRLPAPAGDDPQGAAGSWHGDVLIFDQFEEVLTVDPTDRDAKHAFFEQVGQALRDRNRWALFSMREEYVASLDPYLRPIPARFDRGRRYRLELLGPDAAQEAMQRPAGDQDPPVAFTEAAAHQLVDDLRRTQVQQPDGTMTPTLGPCIEPVHLQVVCRRLWDGLAPDDVSIDVDDLGAVGNVDSALAGYYAERVKAVAEDSGVRERSIREWFDRQLITEAGIRGQVLMAAETSQGLANAAIWPLVDAHLVRAEQRRGATWFELAHDRLIVPVRADNTAWFAAHLSTLQQQAALWEQQKRPDGLLLSGQTLAEAERWAGAQSQALEPHEQEFLAACQEAQTRFEHERRQAQRIRRLATGATTATALAVIALFVAIFLFLQAVREGQLSFSRQLAAQSASHLDDQYNVALLLALEANRVASTVEGRGSLLDALEHTPQWATTLRDNLTAVWSIAFSPDGTTLAAGVEAVSTPAPEASPGPTPASLASSTQIVLWDVASRRTIPDSRLTLPGHGAVVITYSPDGKMIAAGSTDGQIYLWRPSAGPVTRQSLQGHPGQVDALCFSDDGLWLASRGKQDILLWKLEAEERPIATTLVSGEEVHSLAFRPGRRILAVGYGDGRIVLWDIEARQPTELVSANKDGDGQPITPTSLAFSPDGLWLAAARTDKLVALYSSDMPQEVRILEGHTAKVEGVAFQPDGKRLASWWSDKTIRLWEIPSGKPVGGPLTGHTNRVWSTAFSPQGLLMALGGQNEGLILWNAETRTRLARPLVGGHEDEVWALALSHDGRRLASAGKDKRIALWDVASGKAITWTAHAAPVRTLAFSPDDKTLASGGQEGHVILWDVAAGQARPPIKEELVHTEGQDSTGVAFSPDGRYLASSSFDKTIRLWDLRASPPISRTLAGHPGKVWSIAFSPDGRMLASGDDEGSIQRWDVASGKPAGTPMIHTGGAYSVAFSSDGNSLASGGPNHQVIIWDVRTGQAVRRLSRHTDTVASVAFAPKCLAESAVWCAGTLATSSYDSTVILWDVATGRMIGQPLKGHDKTVNGLAWSADSKVLADASDDHTIMVWNMDFKDWQARACRIANRDLASEEWQQYMGTEPYRSTCAGVSGR